MVHHPAAGDVKKGEWLTKTANTSKSSEPDQPSEKSLVVLNYDSIFGALHRSRKIPQNSNEVGQYISKKRQKDGFK